MLRFNAASPQIAHCVGSVQSAVDHHHRDIVTQFYSVPVVAVADRRVGGILLHLCHLLCGLLHTRGLLGESCIDVCWCRAADILQIFRIFFRTSSRGLQGAPRRCLIALMSLRAFKSLRKALGAVKRIADFILVKLYQFFILAWLGV